MSEANGIINGVNSTPATPGQQEPKRKLKDRIKSRCHSIEAKHPKLVKTVKWIGRGGAVAGAFLLGRKSVKPTTIYVQPIAEEPEAEPPETEEQLPDDIPAEEEATD